MQLKSTTSDLERELRISIDKAMQCDRREPPKEPVIAMSPKRFSQLVGLLRHDLDRHLFSADIHKFVFINNQFCSHGGVDIELHYAMSQMEISLSWYMRKQEKRNIFEEWHKSVVSNPLCNQKAWSTPPLP
ncbi:hypothetical protein AVEN_175985-1 [Araneus ventricosus]|uniref:Uncharacterized protein n=1 Tax=Araneus ventricosus TaxID=182803 RepID=A0A4Y2EMW2_ARAVE|nr:hypothetical protein AVEN_175985-1 [Araneus ventricosus]